MWNFILLVKLFSYAAIINSNMQVKNVKKFKLFVSAIKLTKAKLRIYSKQKFVNKSKTKNLFQAKICLKNQN